MIVTVFGDVHGNLIALEKLFKIEKNATDLFISHGDVVNYGPWSNECITYLKSEKKCKMIKGNHEQFYIDGIYGGTNIIAKTFFQKCYADFDVNLTNDLIKYEDKIIIDNFTIQHTINDSYIFADTLLVDFEMNNDYIIGHSHQQYYKKVGKKMLYNTGSIGQNRQYLNQSCYLQINSETKSVVLKSFIHDIDLVLNEMRRKKYPNLCMEYYMSKQRVSI